VWYPVVDFWETAAALKLDPQKEENKEIKYI